MKKWTAVLLAAILACGFAAALAEAGSTGTSGAVPAPGDVILFGSYEQDNQPDNGPEPIEWTVLEVQEGKALLLSCCGLDAVPYHEPWNEDDFTWETCTLRAWLNDSFLNTAFTGEEQGKILLTAVDNGPEQGNSQWTLDGGNDTEDRIFLLSFAEAARYLDLQYVYMHDPDEKSNAAAQARPTAYAVARGVMVNGDYVLRSDRDMGDWWLRSPAHYPGFASAVSVSGFLGAPRASTKTVAVRPALWIGLE